MARETRVLGAVSQMVALCAAVAETCPGRRTRPVSSATAGFAQDAHRAQSMTPIIKKLRSVVLYDNGLLHFFKPGSFI
jgi:hypothetical protein